ncbi:MAG: NAD(P)-dependent oxidoreductase [Rhodospirillales bacterium]|nr:NAD(P)-dependent oxidoreductase [Rhodospirillales bacterium]
MRVLVTGTGGFLGRALAADLARRGFDVVAAYRATLPTPFAPPAPRLVALDLAELSALPGPVDAVVHAAATSAWTGVSAEAMARDNVEATRRLIGAAKVAGAAKFIFCSSMSAFGDIKSGSVDEATPVANPDVYGMTKLVGEAMLREAAPGLAGLALRLPAVIGPGAKRNFLAVAADKLKAGQPVSIFNPDSPFNNAVHSADLAAFVATVLEKGWQGFDMLVLGAAGQMTIRGAVERLRARLGPAVPVEVRTAGKGAFTLDSRRAVAAYGYRPMEIGPMLDRYAGEA